jgi:ketosteroid isomerase-like protein
MERRGRSIALQPTQVDSTMPVTQTAQANQALIEGAYAAFARGDIPTVLQVLDEDILWHVPGRGPLSRDYRGHQEVLGFFQEFMELSAGTFRIRVDDVLANDERVIVLVTESAERNGAPLVVAPGARLDGSGREGVGLLAVPG